MTGLPGLVEMRSLNKSGLSIITLVFTDATDEYFARQLVTERLIEVTPQNEFITYGVGVPLMQMRNPEQARGRAPVN